jgi:hypothetical protein
MEAEKHNTLLLWIVAFCIGSFKILLVSNSESGIRIDDFLITFGVCVVLLSGQYRRVHISKAVWAYSLFLTVGVLSSIWNGYRGRVSASYSLLYVGRQLEYMAFFWFGYLLNVRRKALSSFLLVYAVILLMVVPSQMLGLVPVPGNFGTARASGNTNGPYELAAVASFLVCYFGYEYRRFWTAGTGVLLVVLSASRITSVGLLVSLVKAGVKNTARLKVVASAAVLLVLALVGTGVAYLAGFELESPSENSQFVLLNRFVSSSLPVEDLGPIYDMAPVYRTSEAYIADMYFNATNFARMDVGDVSGMIRMFRWTSLLKSTVQSADSILLGLGPSFGTAAVDGYFVRVFIETGALGLISFLYFVGCLRRKGTSKPIAEYTSILVATACFIDIFVAYKPMILLWLWHGLSCAATTEDRDARRISDAG